MKVGIALLVLVIALRIKSFLHLLRAMMLKPVGINSVACWFVLTFVPFINLLVDGTLGVLSGDQSL